MTYYFDDLVAVTGSSVGKVNQFIAQTKFSGFFAKESTREKYGTQRHYRNVYSQTYFDAFKEFVSKEPSKQPWNMAEVTDDKPDDSLIALLRKNSPIAISDLANSLSCSPAQAEAKCQRLADLGHHVVISSEEVTLQRQLTQAPTFLAPSWGKGPTYKMGIISDTHYGNRHSKLESVKYAYEYFEKNGCSFVIHGGDVVDGPPSMHKGFEYELCLHELDEQMAFVRENHPTNLPTIFFGGNHDLSWYKSSGYSIAWNLCRDQEKPWHFGGDIDGFVAGPDGNECFTFIAHPGGGGAYATSWSSQKANEYLSHSLDSLTAELEKLNPARMPRFMFMGHYHKRCYTLGAEGGHVYQVPASCDLTGFQRMHRLQNHTGALMLEFGLDNKGNVDHHIATWLDYTVGDEISYTKESVRTKRTVSLW